MKALVLGGSVFVGRRTVLTLVEQGHDVTVLNRGKTATDIPDSVNRLVADRTDTSSMKSALEGKDWDAIFDVSGFVMVAGGSDIQSLLDLVDGHVGRYVFVSSVMAYEQERQVFPWYESDPTNDNGPEDYGGFKVMVEQALAERHARTKFPMTVVRPAAIYGPDNNIYDMETPMFLRLLQGRPVLLPHGGHIVCSYGHVDDLVDAMIKSVTAEKANGEIFNITNEGVSTNFYAKTIANIVGVTPNIVYLPDELLPPFGKVAFNHLHGVGFHSALSIDKARRLLDWEPKYDFRSGHAHTFEWFKSKGWDSLEGALSDPTWGPMGWDFDFEAELAAKVRG